MPIVSRTFLAAALVAALATAHAGPRVLLHADFNDKPIDQPLMARGPAFDEPVRNDVAYVRLAPFDSPHIEIVDASTCCALTAAFEFPNSEEIRTGTLDIRSDVYFPAPVSAEIVALREQGSSAVNFLDFYTGTLTSGTPNGNGWLNAYAGETYSGSLLNPGYPIGRWVTMRTQYSPDRKRVRLELDGKLVWEKSDFALNTTRGAGRLLIGNNDTGPRTGSVMRVDNLRVVHCDSPAFGDCLLASGFDD